MRSVALALALAVALGGLVIVVTPTTEARCVVGYAPGCLAPPPCLPTNCCRSDPICPPPPP